MGQQLPARYSEARGRLCPTEPHVWDRLLESALHFPQRLAVACLHQPAALYRPDQKASEGDYLRWTYSDLKIGVDNLANSLLALGLGTRDVLSASLDNGIEFVLTFWAAHKLGITFVPINPKTLRNHEEAEHMFKVANISAIIVNDGVHANEIDKMNHSVAIKARIVVSGELPDKRWIPFSSLLHPKGTEAPVQSDPRSDSRQETVTVLFTSGTTSKPKGAPHTSTTLNAFCQNLSPETTSHSQIFCSVLPNNHAMGYFFPLHYMMHGAAIVYPSGVFDAPRMATALQLEKVTHTAIVASALHSLLEAISSLEVEFESYLEDVCLSGSSVTPANIRDVFLKLGSKGVSTGFGMTEGSPIWCTSKQTPEDLIVGDHAIAGIVSPGAHVRLCAPGSRNPVPQGEPGEIHQSGAGVITSYLNTSQDSKDFYTDESGRVWFITGDQAIMHHDERFSITGRYKEMIVRGGENIAPAAIEATIYRHCEIQCFVVGVPDSIAGEVPVLVLKEASDKIQEQIRDTILHHLGPAFVPEVMISFDQLGLTDVPRTASMKVQKAKLAKIVLDHLGSAEEPSKESAEGSIKHHLLKAYSKATGMPMDKLDANAKVAQFADSIALMRVRDYLRKNVGRTLSIQEMTQHSTLGSQIALLERRAAMQGQGRWKSVTYQSPSIEELEVLFEGRKEAEIMRLQISRILEARGLRWGQVSSLIPAHDYMQALLKSKIIDTWNFAIAVTTQCHDISALRQSLKTTLPYHPVLTSFVVIDHKERPYYVTLQPNETLWDLCLVDYGSVDSIAELQQLAVDFPRKDLARMPGPLFTCQLVHVKETNSASMIIYIHHIVQDASSLRLFLEDLNRSLMDPPRSITPHTDFKTWADSYLSLRNSPEATASVKFHVTRLRNLQQYKDALYPPAINPRQAITESPDGLDYSFDAPELVELISKHPALSAPIVLKAAMALVNVNRTGHDYSAFFNFEAGRAGFPFVPATVRAMKPDAFEASDVNGPTMQGVCNLIAVPRKEAALNFLTRVAEEQAELTKHCHAPLQRIIDALDAEADGAGTTLMEVHRTQFTTWVPGLLGDYERLEVAKIAIRCAAGLVVVAGLGGPTATTFGLSLRWDVANYSREESAEFVDDLQLAVRWLIAAENWDRPLGDFATTAARPS